jgi:ATPase subunit of ABC transporter with duplicated ATPase domains
VALVRLLISSPEILLLDEPTNHLDAESVAWLEQFLFRYKGSVIAITHDRYVSLAIYALICKIFFGQRRWLDFGD